MYPYIFIDNSYSNSSFKATHINYIKRKRKTTKKQIVKYLLPILPCSYFVLSSDPHGLVRKRKGEIKTDFHTHRHGHTSKKLLGSPLSLAASSKRKTNISMSVFVGSTWMSPLRLGSQEQRSRLLMAPEFTAGERTGHPGSLKGTPRLMKKPWKAGGAAIGDAE